MREPHSPQENEALEPSRVTEYHPATNYKVVNLQESDSDCEIIDNIGGESNQKIQQLSCVVISSEESDDDPAAVKVRKNPFVLVKDIYTLIEPHLVNGSVMLKPELENSLIAASPALRKSSRSRVSKQTHANEQRRLPRKKVTLKNEENRQMFDSESDNEDSGHESSATTNVDAAAKQKDILKNLTHYSEDVNRMILKYISLDEITQIDFTIDNSRVSDERRIFNRSQPKTKKKVTTGKSRTLNTDKSSATNLLKPSESEPTTFPSRKRVAHKSNNSTSTILQNSRTKAASKKQPRLAPRDQMESRPATVMREKLTQKKLSDFNLLKKKSYTTTTETGRTAHSGTVRNSNAIHETVPYELKGTSRRMAHVPLVSKIVGAKPMALVPIRLNKATITVGTRQQKLDVIYKCAISIFHDDKKRAKEWASNEEQKCANSAKTLPGYLFNTAKVVKDLNSKTAVPTAAIKPVNNQLAYEADTVIFKKNVSRVAHNKKTAGSITVSTVRGGSETNTERRLKRIDRSTMANKGIYSAETLGINGDTKEFYAAMEKYLMTEQQLKDNNYPRPTDRIGQCAFYGTRSGYRPLQSSSNKKNCVRCHKTFQFYDDLDRNEELNECNFHPSRCQSSRGDPEKRYSCCNQGPASMGCSYNESHVHDDNKRDCNNYVQIKRRKMKAGRCPGVFSIDCEMCYTVEGFELCRVSVVTSRMKTVYDKYVKPKGRVLDYNTKFSGVTKEDLTHAEKTIEDVQADFINLFSSETIFVGHSLESDLIALKIIHNRVVDTSIVYPHNRGPPLKRALRNLMSEHLGITIQSGDVEGHDSTEDAKSCIQLMKYKINT